MSATLREAVIAAITLPVAPDEPSREPPGSDRVTARAVALRAVLAEAPGKLSPAEEHLLGEWLDRLADTER